MYRTRQYHIKKGHKMYQYCYELCEKSAHLYNRANFLIRQYATAVRDFENFRPLRKNQLEVYNLVNSTTKETKYQPRSKWLNYGTLDYILKMTHDNSYYAMFSQSNQQMLKKILRDYKSFFESIKRYSEDTEGYTGRPKMPKYKKNGILSTSILTNQICKIVDDKYLKVPGYKYKLNLGNIDESAKLKEVRIKKQAGVFVIDVVLEISESSKTESKLFTMSEEQLQDYLRTKKDISNIRILGIDPGLDNFCAITNNFGVRPLLIKGKTLKSTNNYYNKRLAKLKSKAKLCNDRLYTKRIGRLTHKRNCKIKDSLHKISKYIIDYAMQNKVDIVILGHNKFQKQEINIGAANNQSFVQIPHYVFAGMLQYKLEEAGIRLVLTEESYTSKADYKAMDTMPELKKGQKEEIIFSGKRIKRGLYKYSDGSIGNADINGAANIIRKVFPNVIRWDIGLVDNPYAVTVA